MSEQDRTPVLISEREAGDMLHITYHVDPTKPQDEPWVRVYSFDLRQTDPEAVYPPDMAASARTEAAGLAVAARDWLWSLGL